MSKPAYSTETPRDAAKPAAPLRPTPAAARRPLVPNSRPVEILEHPDLPGVSVQFEMVTPTLAEHYLQKVPDWQRHESEKTTDEYADDMIDGDWMFTGDALRFTDHDELFDGRHRCQAIVTSGEEQRLLVIRGLDRKTMRVLDTGYQRRFTNYLSTQKVPYINSVSNLTGKILDWRRGNYAHPGVARMPGARYINAKKSHQKLIHTFEDLRDEILTAVKRGQAIRNQFPGSAPDTVFGFAYLYLGRLDPYKREEFFTELLQQARSTDPTYPIRALEKTLTGRSGERGIGSYMWLSWIFRTWNHWLREEPLSKEQFRNIRRPRWDYLAIPEDPDQLDRPEGWNAL
jgi:hypothetical protein